MSVAKFELRDMFAVASTELYPLIVQSLDLSSRRYGAEEWSFARLDAWRGELNATVAARWAHDAATWITRDELILLMDWKLARGKFRPTLPKLVRQNNAADVEAVTKRAFAMLLKDIDAPRPQYLAGVKAATKQASELRGIGPATASLILSLAANILPRAPPFFSDEAFLYFVVEPTRPGSAIKYSLKEYTDEYVPAVLAAAHSLPYVTVEQGAWSLKYYDLGKIDTMADVKVPAALATAAFAKYAAKDEPEANPSKRRLSDTEAKPATRALKKAK